MKRLLFWLLAIAMIGAYATDFDFKTLAFPQSLASTLPSPSGPQGTPPKVTDGTFTPNAFSKYAPHDTDRRAEQREIERRGYLPLVQQTAQKYSIPVPVLIGIASRESVWGLGEGYAPKGPAGIGDGGLAFGLFQIDKRWHGSFVNSGDWQDPAHNLDYAGRLLKEFRRVLTQRTNLEGEFLLRATVAAFNRGTDSLLPYLRQGNLDHLSPKQFSQLIDQVTDQGNYSADVFERATWHHIHSTF